MKPERTFIAERPLARHCPELLRPAPAVDELLPSLALVGERLARSLATGLARLSGGSAPVVRSGPPRECAMAELGATIAPLAANSLLTAEGRNAPILASVEAAAVLRMVDLAFGGRGHVPATMPEAFPLSAELLVTRIETTVATAVAEAFGSRIDGEIRPTRRNPCLETLAAFPAETPLVALSIEVHEANAASPWTLTIALPADMLVELFGNARPASATAARREANPAEDPFGDLPLSLTAVLVDMGIGFSQLSELKPGDILPVAVARNVPLKVGGRTIAHGTIGEMDDRVAVQITHAF